MDIDLVAGEERTLRDGTRVRLEHVGYAHAKDDANESDATLTIARGDQRATVILNRRDGGRAPTSAAEPQRVFGWVFTLVSTSAYTTRARAKVTVVRE